MSRKRTALVAVGAALPLFTSSLAAGATSGKIHFSGVTTGQDTTYDVVTGAIDDYGKDVSKGRNAQKIILKQGTFTVDTTKLNKSFTFKKSKTGCSGMASGSGTDMPISKGTGAYAGISGSITVKASFVQLGKVVDGKCSLKKEVAGNGTVVGDGSVSF